jgi:hypothetical protein
LLSKALLLNRTYELPPRRHARAEVKKPMTEKESFDQVIRVLEEALEKASRFLGPGTDRTPTSKNWTLENAHKVYEALYDLLKAARAGRAKLP